MLHIVQTKGLIWLGLTTLKKMWLFQKHPRVFIGSMDIQQIQKDNLAKCVTGGCKSNDNANEQTSVSDAEWLDPGTTEIMDVTEEWVDTENID